MQRDEYEKLVEWGVVVLGFTPREAAQRADKIAARSDEMQKEINKRYNSYGFPVNQS